MSDFSSSGQPPCSTQLTFPPTSRSCPSPTDPTALAHQLDQQARSRPLGRHASPVLLAGPRAADETLPLLPLSPILTTVSCPSLVLPILLVRQSCQSCIPILPSLPACQSSIGS
jgi:hypothetical protein